jgi:peptidoglycan/LPS O-acetylase OafA/YrhL
MSNRWADGPLDIAREGLRGLWIRPDTQVPSLDALRALAVILVIGGHFSDREWDRIGMPAIGMQHWPVFYWGWTGVDMFFVLSGLLIGRQLWLELQRTGTVNVGRFVLRRGFRIWPLYYAMLLIFYLFARQEVPVNWADLAFVSNYFPGGLPRGWSLSTEEQFYITLPLLLTLMARWVPLRRQAGLIFGLLIAVWASRYVMKGDLLDAGMTLRRVEVVMHYPFHLHCEALLIGLLIAWANTVHPDWGRPRASSGLAIRAFSVFILASGLGLALRRLDKTVFAFTALALIYGGATAWLFWDRSPLTKITRSQFFYPISRLSYGMYLNHFLILAGITDFTVKRLAAQGVPLPVVFLTGTLVGTLVSIAVAAVTFLVVEHPFLHWRERVLGRPRAVPAALSDAAESRGAGVTG